MTDRMKACFAALKEQGRPALVTFVMAGDPDPSQSQEIIDALPAAGADIIEIGMPFSDPMADGPTIQAAGRRALDAGMSLAGTLKTVANFRKNNAHTPIVLMGYYNPIYIYGVDRFLKDALNVGVDGLIVVDLPPEMDDELCIPALKAGINFIRLATPTTDEKRLPTVLKNTSGFVYYVSMTGVTGADIKNTSQVGQAVARIQTHTDLPVCVGFGIKTGEDAQRIAKDADGVVVGTAIIDELVKGLEDGSSKARVVTLIKKLAQGVANASA